MIALMIMAQPASPPRPHKPKKPKKPKMKDIKNTQGGSWSLFPSTGRMNIHSTTDRRRRFDLPSLFTKSSSSRTNMNEDFVGPSGPKAPSQKSAAPSVASSRRKSMSFDQMERAQEYVTDPASAPVVPTAPSLSVHRPGQDIIPPNFPVRISSQAHSERQTRRDKYEREAHRREGDIGEDPQERQYQTYQPKRQNPKSHSPDPSSLQSPAFSQDRSNSPASSRTDMSAPLPPLQQRGFDDGYMLEPLNEEEIEPGSFDLVAPAPNSGVPRYSLEKRSEMLFSAEHLEMIFKDPSLLLRFTAFLGAHRPMSVAMLIYYLDAVKALRAIEYSNAVAEALDPIEGFDFTKRTPTPTENLELKLKIKESFDQLVREDLPAYITHVYIQTVSMTISRRIAGTLPIALRQASEGLAEVFCLSDPSRPDNPILFSSAEFHRTTQYGVDYVIGKNCRFLQGPKTNPFSVKRIRQKIDAGQEHCEVFLNYRRDGSPFMNLLMVAPLIDSNGVIRYFIGAQVDVSGLVKDCSDLESLQRLVDEDEITEQQKKKLQEEALPKDEFQELSDMLNLSELDIVRRWGGRMHKEVNVQTENTDPRSSENWSKPRLLINSGSPDGSKNSRGLSVSGQLRGIYENYLLVGRAPGLHIMFASPSLRVPGILLSPFMKKIGGSQRVRDELTQALADGQGVTAKLRWISKADVAGRSRWFHCTPLLAQSGKVGVWMVVLVDDEDSNPRYRQPPPVDPKFGRFGGASGISTEDGDDRSLISFALGGESRDGAASLRSHAST